MINVYWNLINQRAMRSWEDNNNSHVIPMQDEFVFEYMSEHEDHFSQFSDSIKQGIRARVLKAYPSFVRESHFIAQMQEIVTQSEITSTLLMADNSLDLGMGTDLALQLNGVSFALKITKTDSNTDWEGIKEKRKSDVSVPHPIKVIAEDNNTFSVGKDNGKKLFLFKREIVKNTLEKCQEAAKDGNV